MYKTQNTKSLLVPSCDIQKYWQAKGTHWSAKEDGLKILRLLPVYIFITSNCGLPAPNSPSSISSSQSISLLVCRLVPDTCLGVGTGWPAPPGIRCIRPRGGWQTGKIISHLQENPMTVLTWRPLFPYFNTNWEVNRGKEPISKWEHGAKRTCDNVLQATSAL